MELRDVIDFVLLFSIVSPYLLYSTAYKVPHIFKQYMTQDQLISVSSIIKAVCMILYGYNCLEAGLNASSLMISIPLIAVGQFLNYEVYQKLGRVAAYYGYELGLYNGPQLKGFPFTLGHAQYKGCMLSLLGTFLAFQPTLKLTFFTLIWYIMYFYILLIESSPCGRKI